MQSSGASHAAVKCRFGERAATEIHACNSAGVVGEHKIGQRLGITNRPVVLPRADALLVKGAAQRGVHATLGAKQVTAAAGQIAANFVTRGSFVTARPGI